MTNQPTLLLTGGTGFFGRALLRHWIQQEHAGRPVPQVTILTRAPAAFVRAHPEFSGLRWLDFHTGDICRKESLPWGRHFSHVLHAATESTDGPRLLPLLRYDQIVDGTRNVLDLAVACGAARFLLTSSGGVYGGQPGDVEKISESWPGMPDPLCAENAYSVGKRAAEHLCALYHDTFGLETVIARCFSFVGEDLPLDVHFAIGNFIRDALWRDEIVVSGDGTPLRSYMDQRDLAHWLLTMLDCGQANRAYNVGSDEAVSIAELARLVRDTICPDKPVRILAQGAALARRNRYIPDITRARNELGLELTVGLADAIRASAAAQRQQH